MRYFPASNLTSGTGLTHMAQVYYDRIALSALRKKFMFWKGVETRTLPKKNGKTIQFYRVQELGANTNPANEGDVGTCDTRRRLFRTGKSDGRERAKRAMGSPARFFWRN